MFVSIQIMILLKQQIVFNVRSTLNFTKNLRMPLGTPLTSMIE